MRELFDDDIRCSLNAHRGNISIVAHKFGVDRAEFFEYVRARPELFRIISNFREQLIDKAESFLDEALDKKSVWAIRFTLLTLGKHRLHGPETPETIEAKEAEEFQGRLGKITVEEATFADEIMVRSEAKDDNPSRPEPDYMAKLDEAGNKVICTLALYIGNLRKAAKVLGVNKAQLADYVARRPQVQAGLNTKIDFLNDHAEDTLHDLLDAKQPWAIRFVLKTLGRFRGYSETPLNEMLVPKRTVFIRHLSMTDLCRLDHMCRLVAPPRVDIPLKELPKVPTYNEFVGHVSDVSVSRNVSHESEVPTFAESNSAGQTPAQPAVQIENKVEIKNAELAIVAQPTVAANPVVAAKPVAATNPVVIAQPAVVAQPVVVAKPDPIEQSIAPKSERSGKPTGPILRPGWKGGPEQVIVFKPPAPDMTGFTDQQKMEMEILRDRVSCSMRIREVYNPAWPPDHPAFLDPDETPVNEPDKTTGDRAPPEAT